MGKIDLGRHFHSVIVWYCILDLCFIVRFSCSHCCSSQLPSAHLIILFTRVSLYAVHCSHIEHIKINDYWYYQWLMQHLRVEDSKSCNHNCAKLPPISLCTHSSSLLSVVFGIYILLKLLKRKRNDTDVRVATGVCLQLSYQSLIEGALVRKPEIDSWCISPRWCKAVVRQEIKLTFIANTRSGSHLRSKRSG